MHAGHAGTETRLVEEKKRSVLAKGRGDDIPGCPWRHARPNHKVHTQVWQTQHGHKQVGYITEVSG